MGIEQQKQNTLLSAERLLRQDKIQEALVVLERMAASAASDPLTLNRMGDLLVRFNRKEEAISYYFRIAVEFTQAGFYPKAVAIHKKILRLNPDNIDSLVNLGELYLQRRLPADARAYLLRAAELYLQAKNFSAAREVYEKLAAAEPDDPRHRVRLAETIAAEGDGERAGDELLTLAEMLLKAGKFPDAERTYRRAAELMPERIEPTLGICDCLAAQGQEREALEVLEKSSEDSAAQPAVLGARALIYEKSGRKDKTVELLQESAACDIPASMLQSLFRFRLEAGDIDDLWQRVGPALQSWSGAGKGDKLTDLYEQLAAIEEHGHIPALERWRDSAVDVGDDAATARALEALSKAYRARSMESEADRTLQELRKLAPDSGSVAPPTPTRQEEDREAPASDAEPAAEAVQHEIGDEERRLEAEAPAVPLNRSDEEFVAGRLTQAEILEKYGLHDQALQQVREVIDKFPGHVPAQEKLVLVLRSTQDTKGLAEALIGLALARKAVGDSEAARQAAAEARRIGPFDDKTQALLEGLELLQQPSAEPAPKEPPPQKAAAPPAEAEEEQVVLIDFDDVEEEETEEPAVIQTPVATPAQAQVGTAPGASAVAVKQAGGAPPAMTPAVEAAAAQPAGDIASSPMLDNTLDDLSAITAALEGEVFTEDAEPLPADAEAEQSLEEVFATFKKHVSEEVDSEDFRTHYDLGIAYKEMGFLDEAISEFEQAAGAGDLEREVPTMLAMCHRQKGDTQRAAEFYRQAIELAGDEGEPLCELRYELADMHVETGDARNALELFRAILEDDPSFRDVADRVAQLDSAS